MPFVGDRLPHHYGKQQRRPQPLRIAFVDVNTVPNGLHAAVPVVDVDACESLPELIGAGAGGLSKY